MNKKYILKCKICGEDRTFDSYDNFYEMKRTKRELCHTCSIKEAWKRRKNKNTYSKYNKIFHIGDKFGEFTVIDDKIEHCYIKCKCSCGEIVKCKPHILLKSKNGRCKKCSVGKFSPNWRGCGEVPMMMLIRANDRARRDNRKCDLTIKYLSELYEKQHRKCALSGIDLHFGIKNKCLKTASLDRIDSSDGYIKGNVQWVHKDINFMKQYFDEKYFKEMCKKVTDYDKNRI